MVAHLKRYKLVFLGHSEELIQGGLDSITENIVGVVSVGVNVLAIVDSSPSNLDQAIVQARQIKPQKTK